MMMRRKPSLFLIGAMKAGTTYLRKLLNAHPDIFMCEPDEPSYFVDPRQLKTVWPDMWERGLWRNEERYLALFQPGGDVPILGEASTNYSKLPALPGVPERIAAFNPDARFVYLLRDPVERSVSHYWHMVRHHAEHRPIVDAVRQDPQFLAVSHYAMQLRPFLERFGREHVMVLVHEQLVADPAGVMRGLYGWLGADAAAADMSGFAHPENVAPDIISMPRLAGVPRRLRQAQGLRGVMERIPPTVHRFLHEISTREVHRRAVDVAEAAAFLRSKQLGQTEDLTRLLGRSFPEWTTLYGRPNPGASLQRQEQPLSRAVAHSNGP